MSSGGITYDVEHVFLEDGKEVRKVPVKVGSNTYGVDVVDRRPEAPQSESSIRLESFFSTVTVCPLSLKISDRLSKAFKAFNISTPKFLHFYHGL